MKLTIKHYYSFGNKANDVGKNLINPKSWDAIRLDDNINTPFSIPKNRNEWVQKCMNHKVMVQRATAITDFLKNQGKNYKKIYSYGVGAGFMEYNLKLQNPEIFLYCSDYAKKAVDRLKTVFKEANAIEVFDMLSEKWPNQGKDTLYLLHRLDADFSNNQWNAIFNNMSLTGIENILFVPCDVSSVKFLIREKVGYFYQLLKRSKMSFAGYLRTKDQLDSLFKKYYHCSKELAIGDLTGFLLKKK